MSLTMPNLTMPNLFCNSTCKSMANVIENQRAPARKWVTYLLSQHAGICSNQQLPSYPLALHLMSLHILPFSSVQSITCISSFKVLFLYLIIDRQPCSAYG